MAANEIVLLGLLAVVVLAASYLIYDEYRYRKAWGEAGRRLAKQHLRMAGIIR